MSLSTLFRWFYEPEAQKQKSENGSICGEKEFMRVLARERAKAERSSHQFSLVVFETGRHRGRLENHLLHELSARMRATDEAGWLKENQIGAILHNANSKDGWVFARNVQMSLLAEGKELKCEVYSFPPPSRKDIELKEENPGDRSEAYNSVQQRIRGSSWEDMKLIYARKATGLKRFMDIVGSLFGLIALSPVFIILWVLIKSVSKGPALYRQTRIGLAGRPFTFLKFRTMTTNADTTSHRRYLASLIHGNKGQKGSKPMLKLDDSNDSIIPFGKFIRKTYLDELPQLFNVLHGEMSLIGPRPPIPYEVEEYKLWHAGRFDAMPGMTGLWQVSGKNKLTFDQMVRLDIRYVRKQSFWLDLMILCLTPVAIGGELKEVCVKIMGQLWFGAEKTA